MAAGSAGSFLVAGSAGVTKQFSLDGVTDFGVVTLACDDDKRIQAHKVYLATGSVGSSLSSTTGFSWTLRYIWLLV